MAPIVVCAWCTGIRYLYRRLIEITGIPVSHGICDRCTAVLEAEEEALTHGRNE